MQHLHGELLKTKSMREQSSYESYHGIQVTTASVVKAHRATMYPFTRKSRVTDCLVAISETDLHTRMMDSWLEVEKSRAPKRHRNGFHRRFRSYRLIAVGWPISCNCCQLWPVLKESLRFKREPAEMLDTNPTRVAGWSANQ